MLRPLKYIDKTHVQQLAGFSLLNLDVYITKNGYDIVKFNKYIKSCMQHLAGKG